MTQCAYNDRNRVAGAVKCSSSHATHIVHDNRGCMPVCARHALWRTTTSQSHGHSSNCSKFPEPRLFGQNQITTIPIGYVDRRPVNYRAGIGQIVDNRPVGTGLSLGWLLVLATAIAIPVLTLTQVGKKT